MKFTGITSSGDHLYAIQEDGTIWVGEKPPAEFMIESGPQYQWTCDDSLKSSTSATCITEEKAEPILGGLLSVDDSLCNIKLRDEGKPTPRTCAGCQLGPCKYQATYKSL